MAQRIDVELTSHRDDGTWTWRAAGARQPKGDVTADLVPEGASVGDVLRAEVEAGIDGMQIATLAPPKVRKRKEPQRIEILGSGDDAPGVTTQLAPKRGGRGGRGGDRRDRGERGGRGGDRRDRGERGGRGGDRRDRPRRERPAAEQRPKPKRLKAGRTHRNEVLRTVDEAQRPLAELLLRGGIPEVRKALDRMDAAARDRSQPRVDAEPILRVGEQLLPHLRMAEWHDRADAALADVDEVDLRDLRQVVVAAEANARDEATRALADQLRDALARRVDAEHAAWLAELDQLLADGRVVRALRLSSRPPKAGARFPTELANRLAEGAASSLTADVGGDRYAVVLDALAYSPVRAQVAPEGVPTPVPDDLVAVVRKLADRIPPVATAFGIEATAPKRRGGRRRGGAKKAAARPAPSEGAAPAAEARSSDEATPAAEAAPSEGAAPAAEARSSDEATPAAEATPSATPPADG